MNYACYFCEIKCLQPTYNHNCYNNPFKKQFTAYIHIKQRKKILIVLYNGKNIIIDDDISLGPGNRIITHLAALLGNNFYAKGFHINKNEDNVPFALSQFSN